MIFISTAIIASSFVAIMIMRVMQSLFNKQTSNTLIGSMRVYIFYIALKSSLSAAFSVITLLIFRDFSTISLQGIAISGISGIFIAISAYFGIISLRHNPMVLCSIFSTAGMLIPIIASSFLFGDKLSAYQIIFVLTLFVGIYLIISSRGKSNRRSAFSVKSFFLLFGSFLCNGACMLCQKLFGEFHADENVSLFSLLTFLIPAILLGIAIPLMPKGEENSNVFKMIPKKLYGIASVLAFAVFVINQLVTMMTPYVDPAVLFAIVNGGASVISATVGFIIYKEKLSLKSGIGIIIAVVSLVLIKAFDLKG